MSLENSNKSSDFTFALPLNIPNIIESVLDTPICKLNKIKIGTLGNNNLVASKNGPIHIDRSGARPGQKVVIHTT